MNEAAKEQVRFGRSGLVIRRGPVALRLDRRAALVIAIALLCTLTMGLVALAVGDVFVPLSDVVSALFGGGTERARMVVVDWRLPRVLVALILGACLAMSGAIFQSLTRNPLGSPDIIGFSAGSYSGALLMIVLGGAGYAAVAGGALIGGIVTAIAVYVLAYRRGVQGFRLIVVGIGVAAMLGSVNTLLIVRADLDVAMQAAVWGAGSLAGIGFSQLSVIALAFAVLTPVAVAAGPVLRQLELGDDAAAASGVAVERSRLLLMVLGVALTALVTAAAGPIAFVALVAPQIARRLTDGSALSVGVSASIGAPLLLAADIAGQRLFPASLPVGVMTVCLGGLYFVWLLAREARRA